MADSLPFNAIKVDGEFDRVFKAEDWAWYFATCAPSALSSITPLLVGFLKAYPFIKAYPIFTLISMPLCATTCSPSLGFGNSAGRV